MRTLRVVRISAVVASLLAMGTAAPAWGQWSAPFTVSDADSRNPGVGIDIEGNAVFKWERLDGTVWRVQARRRTATGILRFAAYVSRGHWDSSESQIAVRPSDGASFFIWRRASPLGRPHEIFVRMRSSDDQLGEHNPLGSRTGRFPPTGPGPQVDPSGVVTAIRDGVIVRSAIPFQGDALLSRRAGVGIGSDPQVVVDVNSSIIFAWLGFDGTNFRVQSRARVGGQWRPGGSGKNLSHAGRDATAPKLATDPLGNTVAVWTSFDGTNWRVGSRTRSAAGVWSRIQTLSYLGEDAFDPQVALDANGNAVFAWKRSDGTNDRVQTRTRAADGTRTVIQNVSDLGVDASAPQVAVDADGNALFAWLVNDGANTRVQVRIRSAAGVLGTVETLSAGGQDALAPRIAVNPSGDAVVVYQTSLGQIIGHVGP